MIRDANEADVARVNELRRQVNEVHVLGRPDIFKPGFGEDLQRRVLEYLRRPDWRLLVAERGGELVGYATLEYVSHPGSPYNLPGKFVHITEFGVDEHCKRQGVGRELFEYIAADGREKGYASVKLDMWAFNEDAKLFYESMGMRCYLRFLEMPLQEG